MACASCIVANFYGLFWQSGGHRHSVPDTAPACAPARQVDAAVAEAVRRFGGLDVAVANAGIVKAAPFLEMSQEDFDAVIRV